MKPDVITTCCCCGVYLAVKEAEWVSVGLEGEDDYMCRRCYNEECDCHDDLDIWQEQDETGALWTYRVIM